MDASGLPADFEDFKKSVLDDARADWTGVYEVWWEANTRYPTLPASQRLAIAEQVVGDLLREERVRMYRGHWHGSEKTVVPRVQVFDVLKDSATWVPQEAEMVWIASDAPPERKGNREQSA